MSSGVSCLSRELWFLMNSDGGVRLRDLLHYRKQSERLGALEELLREVIKRSSIGYFAGRLYYFSGKIYESISSDELENLLTDLLFDRVCLPRNDYNSVYYTLSRCMRLARSKRLSVDNGIMVFNNGVLDTVSNKFHKGFDKKFVQLASVDYDYNAGARTFLWYQFLNQVLPDKRLQEILQMFLGATFLDRKKVKIETLMILLGKGSNGKSVIQNTVCGVLGHQYVTSKSVGSLCARGIDGEESVALINGKRLNYCTEMEVTDFYRKSARLKAIISGERVSARYRYERGFDADNIPLLMANANQLPVFNDHDDALMRRIYVIPFDVIIPVEKQNKTLNLELEAEYPAILNWILEGREKLIENNYRLPEDLYLKKILAVGETDYNLALKYMDSNGWHAKIDGVDIIPRHWIKLSVLYNGFVRWCELNDVQPMSKTLFSKELEDKGKFVKKRESSGYVFAVFGQITLNALRKEQRALERVKSEAPKSSLIWVDGVAYLSSMKALATYSGVSVSVITSLCRKGVFQAYTKAYREKKMYDVQSCCQKMRELKIIATDEEKEILTRVSKAKKYMRYVFNRKMEFHNLPYRKYAREEQQIEDDIIVVPDEMSDYDVFLRAHEEFGFDMEHVNLKQSYGPFGRRGKGFFESVDDIPVEELDFIK